MDISTLADLKAEVVRKRNEARFNKVQGRDKKDSVLNLKSDPLLGKSNKKQQTEAKPKSGRVDPDEERRVQSALEMKARLYNQMKSGQVEDKDGKFLINFNKGKNNEDDSDLSDNEGKSHPELLSEDGRREILRRKWEEEEEENLKKADLHYGDVLFDEARTHGAAFYNFSRDEATRAKELEELKQMHEQTKREREEKEKSKQDRKSALANRLKKVRDRKRLKMGLPMLESDDEDVPSVEENPEEKSQEELNDAVMKALRDIREKEEAAKRRLVVRDWDVGKNDKTSSSPSSSSLLTMKPSEPKILSQDEWVQAKRSERQTEFAPPVNLYKGESKSLEKASRDKSYSTVPPPQMSSPAKQQFSARSQFPPPKAYSQQLPQPVRTRGTPPSGNNPRLHRNPMPRGGQPQNRGQPRPGPSSENKWGPPSSYTPRPGGPKRQFQDSFAPPPGYQQERTREDFEYKNNFVEKRQQRSNFEAVEDSDWNIPEESLARSALSKNSRLELHKQMREGYHDMAKPIVNEMDKDFFVDTLHSTEQQLPKPAGKSVEIPPPCDMDYYADTSAASKRSNWQGMRTRQEMTDSFSFGLGQLKKRKPKEGDSDDESD